MDPAEEPVVEDGSREEQPRRRWRLRATLVLLVVLVLALVVPPLVNLGRYRRSITEGISAALGRPVSAGEISLRLLPRPGIALSNFTVGEDPAFGYEPVLHAESVVVSPRLSSLWRRRLEIGRISLDGASLNLVKNDAGQWNIDSLLVHAARIPNAPTTQRYAGPTPRFPYIEASDSRINFSNGPEKRPFSLLDAEFSMWQASGGEWRLRLEAQPARTDLELHLSDTGEVYVDGSLRRAAAVNAIPLNLRVRWSGAQLGQVTRMLAGVDSGWRGSLNFSARVQGTPADLKLRSTVDVTNLRRREYQPVSTLDVSATCNAEYLHDQRLFRNITCFLPVAPGHLLMTGSVQGFVAPKADLQVEINHVPVEFPVTLLGMMRSPVENVTATGTMNGEFQLVNAEQEFTGGLAASGVTVTNSGGTWTLPDLRFAAAEAGPIATRTRAAAAKGVRAAAQGENAIVLEPVSIPFGEPTAMTAQGQLTGEGFTLHLAGAAALHRLAMPGAAFGLLGGSLSPAGTQGRAELNVTTQGNWLAPLGGSTTGVNTTGTVQIQGAELHPGFLRGPVDVTTAEVVLGPQQISWENAAIRYSGMALRGSMEYPRTCDDPAGCAATFAVQAAALNAGSVEAALTGAPKRGFFGQIMADLSRQKPAAWPRMQGTIRATTFQLARLPLKNATAVVETGPTGLTVRSLDARALGGTVHANGSMTVSQGTPQWKVNAILTAIRPAAAAKLLKQKWGSGVLNGQTSLTLTGLRASDLEASAAGTFHFTWQNGGVGKGPLQHFGLWTAGGAVIDSALELDSGGVVQKGRIEPVRGTIGFGRRIRLTVQTRKGRVQVAGTLAQAR